MNSPELLGFGAIGQAPQAATLGPANVPLARARAGQAPRDIVGYAVTLANGQTFTPGTSTATVTLANGAISLSVRGNNLAVQYGLLGDVLRLVVPRRRDEGVDERR
jgi:hypothetical protein